MLDSIVDHQIQRTLPAAAGLTDPIRPRWLAWFWALMALSLAVHSQAGFADPNPAWLPGISEPQLLAEALELDDDEPQFSPAASPICLLAFHLAPAPASPHHAVLALTPLTPPPPSA